MAAAAVNVMRKVQHLRFTPPDLWEEIMSACRAMRPANLLDQRLKHGAHVPPLNRHQGFELQCALMLAGHGVYLADLGPEILSNICERLRARHLPLMPAL